MVYFTPAGTGERIRRAAQSRRDRPGGERPDSPGTFSPHRPATGAGGGHARGDRYGLDQSSYSSSPYKTREHLQWVNTLTANLKRFLLGTHHSVHPKYRKAYAVEFAYRFNRRYWPRQAFDRLLFACLQNEPVPLKKIKGPGPKIG